MNMSNRQEGGARRHKGPKRGAKHANKHRNCYTFNAARFLPDTIKSIRAQSYPDIEWALIDGASVENVLQSSERRADLIQKGFKKCVEYSWNRCASETLEIYRGLVR